MVGRDIALDMLPELSPTTKELLKGTHYRNLSSITSTKARVVWMHCRGGEAFREVTEMLIKRGLSFSDCNPTREDLLCDDLELLFGLSNLVKSRLRNATASSFNLLRRLRLRDLSASHNFTRKTLVQIEAAAEAAGLKFLE